MQARNSRRLVVALMAAIACHEFCEHRVGEHPGSRSPASAPTIASGSTESSDSNACPDSDGRQYWAMDLQVGDTLTVNGTPMTDSLSVDLYGPNVQTIGESLCGSEVNGDPFTLSCVIPQAGRYLLVTRGAGQFTPTVSGVPDDRQPRCGLV